MADQGVPFSGSWKGEYITPDNRMATIGADLQFDRNGTIQGRGNDMVGFFRIAGTWKRNNQVFFSLHYSEDQNLGRPLIYFAGYVQGLRKISGKCGRSQSYSVNVNDFEINKL